MRLVTLVYGLLPAFLLAACSENLGPAPPDGGRVVPVRSEGISGPRTERVGISVAAAGGRVLVGTDAGLFAFAESTPAAWEPAHGGFLNPGNVARAGVVRELASDGTGRRVLFRGILGPSHALVASLDGGQSFARLDRPDPLLIDVTAIGVAPAGAMGPGGAWLAVQGGRAFWQPVGDGEWRGHILPSAPDEVAALVADPEGRIGLAVSLPSGAGWRLWSGSVDTDPIADTGIVPDGRPLALAWWQGRLVFATGSGIHDGGGLFVRWPDAVVEAAALQVAGGRLEWALVARDAGGTLQLGSGSGPGQVVDARVLDGEQATGLALGSSGPWVLWPDGSTTGPGGRTAYGGVEVDLFSVAGQPGRAIYAAGHTRTGEIHQGPVSDPAAYSTRGTPLRASAPREIVFDPAVADALFVGSFGVYRSDPATARWEERNTGFSSYDPGYFAGPFPVSALAAVGEGELWVGGVNGDGPYRSRDSGATWQAVHDGLGTPGSYQGEPGLPLVTQVQAFAAGPDGGVWMGGFRGGVFRLGPSATSWEQRSWGLPLVDGAPLDSCCPQPGIAEVDVRDLAALGDGSILAATGWGVYRLARGAEVWEGRSAGLFNQDVHRLLRHPSDTATVLAATRARADAPEWLYLTEDGGRTWFPVESRLVGRRPVDLAWSDPARLEVLVLLEAQGLWRMELDP